MGTFHKVVIGDSRRMTEVEDESVHLCVTSPPYWKLKDYGSEEQIGQADSSYESYFANITEVFRECVRVLAPDGKIAINIMPIFLSGKNSKFGRRVTKTVLSDLELFFDSLGSMYFHSLFIWDKRKAVRISSFGSYPYPSNLFSSFPYEWIIVFAKEGKRKPVSREIKEKSKVSQEEWANWCVNSMWEIQPAKASSENHPAPFPDELPRRIIKLYSFYGDTVLDPFLGSGTTSKVALELGRNSIGYEINEEYVKTIKKKIGYTIPKLGADTNYEFLLKKDKEVELNERQ